MLSYNIVSHNNLHLFIIQFPILKSFFPIKTAMSWNTRFQSTSMCRIRRCTIWWSFIQVDSSLWLFWTLCSYMQVCYFFSIYFFVVLIKIHFFFLQRTTSTFTYRWFRWRGRRRWRGNRWFWGGGGWAKRYCTIVNTCSRWYEMSVW